MSLRKGLSRVITGVEPYRGALEEGRKDGWLIIHFRPGFYRSPTSGMTITDPESFCDSHKTPWNECPCRGSSDGLLP